MALVPASTAVLEFQCYADGDFGLKGIENSTINITGQPRTPGKNVVKCKLTADVVTNNTVTVINSSNWASNNGTGLDASGNSLVVGNPVENSATGNHYAYYYGGALINTTQTATVWMAQGTGPNNRYIRFMVGNTSTFSSVANGFYSDIDLLLGTAGTVTAVGNGAANSVSITAVGRGWLIRMTGRASTVSCNPVVLIVNCSAPGVTSYAGSNASTIFYDRTNLLTAAGVSDTVYMVDADTGWLAGDAICISSTSRTYSECEIVPLNANAGTSSLGSALYPNAFHSGVAPTQAEVILLTRNVKIRSTSTAAMTYAYFGGRCTATVSWAEFYYVGINVTGKYAITCGSVPSGTASPKSFTYCSIHDSEYQAFRLSPGGISNSVNAIFANSVVWAIGSGNVVDISGNIALGDWTFDNIVVMRGAASGGFNLADMSGTFTNNTACSCGNDGFVFGEPVSVLGSFNNNVSHSNAAAGLYINGTTSITGVMNNFTAWRNGNGAVAFGSIGSIALFSFDNALFFGNGNMNFRVVQGFDMLNVTNSTVAGDPLFPTPYGINCITLDPVIINLLNVDMSGVGTSLAPHANSDFHFTGSNQLINIKAINCKFGATVTPLAGKPWEPSSYVIFQKYGQTVGDQRTESSYGQIRTDFDIYHTASPGLRMTPNSTTFKFESGIPGRGMLVDVNSGDTITASVWVRKATSSDPGMSAWNPADMSAGIALSNGGLTAANPGNTQGVRSVNSCNTGKVYFELVVDVANVGFSNAYGIALPGSQTGPLTCALNPYTGVIWYNGSSTGINVGGVSVGSVVCCAIDFTNWRMWIRVGAGNWNGNASYNPATNVGGIDIGLVFSSAAAFACLIWSNAGNQVTANFGATAFANAVPAGFSAWNVNARGYIGSQPRLVVRANQAMGVTNDTVLATYSAGNGAWNQLTGTPPAAPDNGTFDFFVDCDGINGFVHLDDWEFTGVAGATGGLKYWFNATPYVNAGQRGGGLKYWFNGWPCVGGVGSAGSFWAGFL